MFHSVLNRACLGVLALVASTLIVTNAYAATICVPSSFDGSCTASAATISAGIAAASAGGGDTVLVDNGLYVEAPVIDRSLTLQAFNQATEADAGNASVQAIIDGGGVENTLRVLAGVDGVVIDGFEITNPTHTATGTAPAGISVGGDSGSDPTVTVTITNNVVHETASLTRIPATFGAIGILAFNIGAPSLIGGNTVYDLADAQAPTSGGESPGSGRNQGILVKASNGAASGVSIDGNVLHDVLDVAIRCNGVNFATACSVTNNAVYAVGSPGTGFLSGIGIDHFAATGTVSGNEINDITGGFGVGIQATGSTTVSGNSIRNVAGGNASVGPSFFPGSAILTNTSSVAVSDNFLLENAIGVTVAEASAGTVSGVTVNTNCIVANAAGVVNGITGSVDSTSDWWNAADGPSDGGGCGACTGSGDSVVNAAGGTTLVIPFSATPNCSQCGVPLYVGVAGSDTANFCRNSAAPCATIQQAIDVACPGDTVNVAAGAYSEGAQILVDKDITVTGAGKTLTTLTPSTDTGGSGDARGWILVDTGVTFNLANLTMDGAGKLVHQGIRWKGQGSVDNVAFANIKFGTYVGAAVVPFGSGPVDITNSMFTNIERIGALYFGTGVVGSTFADNTYTGKGTGDFLDYALDISAGADLTVTGNTVTGNRGVASSDGSTSAGFLVSTFFAAGTNAVFDGNIVENNTTGVFVGFNTADTSTATLTCNRLNDNDYGIVVVSSDASLVTANDNSISGNAIEGVDAATATSGTMNAENNWWGATDGPSGAGPGSGDSITVNVDADPFEVSVPACVNCTLNDDCDDGLACNGAETCNTGTSMCQAGSPVVCNGQCETGVCVDPAGTCAPVLDGTSCDSGADTCTDPDSCGSGVCLNTGGGGDSDTDTVCDADDNCPADANTDQNDVDEDDIGDVCDADFGFGTLLTSRVKIKASGGASPRGKAVSRILVSDTLAGGQLANDLTVNGDVTVTITAGAFSASGPLGTCQQSSAKKIRCQNGDLKATFRLVPQGNNVFPETYKGNIKFRSQADSDDPTAPAVVQLDQPSSALSRSDDISDCKTRPGKLSCKQQP